MRKHEIDAKDKSLGRVASQAAKFLMGKDNPDFQRHLVADVEVVITNSDQIKLSNKKRKSKTYQTYSGFPGGQKTRTMEEVIEKKGYGEVFQKAVYGMLPNNRLRDKMMKNLKIK